MLSTGAFAAKPGPCPPGPQEDHRMKTLISVISIAFLFAGAASAQQPKAASGDQANRFQLERTEHGLVRLDRQTGAMTLCRDENGTLACRMQPDERAAYDD